ELAFKYDSETAELLGDWKEQGSPGDPVDTFADQWNNEVGRRIAEYMKANNLPETALDDLIIDALNNGDLIWDRDPLDPDPRIDPMDDPKTAPTWTEPTPSWEGAADDRDYSQSDSFSEDPLGLLDR